MCFRYGCHIFHTKHDRVKEYVQQYSDWVPYEHRVIAKAKDVDGKVKFVPMPPNQVIVCQKKWGWFAKIWAFSRLQLTCSSMRISQARKRWWLGWTSGDRLLQVSTD